MNLICVNNESYNPINGFMGLRPSRWRNSPCNVLRAAVILSIAQLYELPTSLLPG